MCAAFAPVAPTALLRELKTIGKLGDYHLLLAHDVLERPDEYMEIFHDVEAYIILDNSVIELGHPLDPDQIQRAYEAVQPSVVVLPDHMRDTTKTLASSIETAKIWAEAGIRNFMAVPQGMSLELILQCATIMDKEIEGIVAWGIGRYIVGIDGTRLRVLHEMLSTSGLCDGRDIHLLGFSDNLYDDMVCSHHPRVRGIDSAVPIRLGLKGVEFQLDVSQPPRGDYWEQTRLNQQAVCNLVRARLMFGNDYYLLHERTKAHLKSSDGGSAQ
jgi:hypothetical protein